ncbi:adenylyl-sulfate kinase, partial [Azospirillum picis]
CEARDPKGLYKKARAGQLPNFTGIDSAYEPPEAPEITLKGAERSPDEMVAAMIEELRNRGII